MPFTIGGEWIPSEETNEISVIKRQGPVKVRKEKRRQVIVTVILNLPLEKTALKALASQLKKQCGCGGTVKDDIIELQGDRLEEIRSILLSQGFKPQ